MKGRLPQVAIVMPVYNALPYLDAAIESLLRQTLSDFCLAIYDDRSTDGSYHRALDWAGRDPRITVHRGTTRLGPCGSSNAAAALATTEFVARMDADDVAAPERLLYQLEVLRANPDAVLIGSAFEMIDGRGQVIRGPVLSHTTGSAPPIAHASIFYRREAFIAAGGYREHTDYFEDQDLYRRLSLHGKLLVSRRPLVQMRFAGQHARLRDDREEVIQRINLLYQGEDAGQGSATTRVLSPAAIYSVAVLAALGLERPKLLGLALKRVDFRQPMKAFGVLAFIATAELSPHAARAMNRLFGRLRKMRSGVSEGQDIHSWVFTER